MEVAQQEKVNKTLNPMFLLRRRTTGQADSTGKQTHNRVNYRPVKSGQQE